MQIRELLKISGKHSPKHQLNLKNVLNQYFVSLKYISFQHLNKNHIQAKLINLLNGGKWSFAFDWSI